jgi:hypothetical protein
MLLTAWPDCSQPTAAASAQWQSNGGPLKLHAPYQWAMHASWQAVFQTWGFDRWYLHYDSAPKEVPFSMIEF